MKRTLIATTGAALLAALYITTPVQAGTVTYFDQGANIQFSFHQRDDHKAHHGNHRAHKGHGHRSHRADRHRSKVHKERRSHKSSSLKRKLIKKHFLKF
ncbi:hypothetical protein [Sulfitobacter sp. S190]|uniref:hypothetical protein n=1 Tax=Sulfitobacter sp. S190 TaxID=2867022 RepID=UPI0021A83B58|nr:hypothetical protein [Sulfitobacter sp. S190]UWR23421.1 hypothetical protein K3756_05395 [Sulfitobacter sp. S190]